MFRRPCGSLLAVYPDMGLVTATLLPLVTGAPLIAMGAFDWLMQPRRPVEETASVPELRRVGLSPCG